MKISQVTEFLENAFVVLNQKYFGGDLPSVVITIQSSPKTYGHYTKYDAWSNKQQGYREINISAETLDRPIEKVIATLIHEMVHHYCDLMGIKDCSRGNTYHNKRFKAECEQRGLVIDYSPKIGYSITSPAPELIAFIAGMGWEGADLARRGEDSQQGPGGSGGPQGPEGPKIRKKSSTRKYQCVGCGCSVRATKEVHIACLDCSLPMLPAEQ